MPGSVNTRELPAGAREIFEIPLSVGHLFQLSLDKGDLAVSIGVYDPQGLKLIERISHGYELVDYSIPIGLTGNYWLEIRSLEIGGPNRPYELKLESARLATATDQKAQLAQQAIANASVLQSQWTEQSLRQAIEKYDQAAFIWASLNNSGRAATANMKAGEVCSALGENREALSRYRRAAAQAKKALWKLEESRALSETGRLLSYLGDNDQAKKYAVAAVQTLPQNVAASHSSFLKGGYAEVLSNIREIEYSKGDLLRSSKQAEEALRLFLEIGDRSGQARSHLFLAYIAGSLGEREKAVKEINQALGLYRAVGNMRGEALCLTALGLFNSLTGTEDSAIKLHGEANQMFRAMGDREGQAITINGLGQAYENLKDYPIALEKYKLALGLFQHMGSLDFASTSLLNIGRVYRSQGDLAEAISYYEKCLQLSRAAKKLRTEANALNDVARLYEKQGDRNKTIKQYQKILSFYISISDRRRQAMAWNNLGEAYSQFGEEQKALESYKRALPLSEQAGDKAVLISALYNIARSQRDLGDLESALASIEKSIEIIESLRTNVASQYFRISYFAGVREHYDLCIDILMLLNSQHPGQGFNTSALLMSEKARARALVDTLNEVRADIRQDVSHELLERERYVGGLLRSQAQYQMELSNSGKDPAELEEVARQINQLRIEYQEIEAQIKDQNSRIIGFSQSIPFSLEQIQTQLRGENSILLEYALGDERSYLWAVTADSFQSYELPSRDILEDACLELYKLITARQEVSEKVPGEYQANIDAADRTYAEKALNLSRLLFGQVANQLGTKRIIVVTEGMLQYIPVDMLPAPQSQSAAQTEGPISPSCEAATPLLIDSNEVAILPSFSTLAAIRRQESMASSDKVVAVFADPVFTTKDERLPMRVSVETVALASDQGARPLALRGLAGSTRDSGPRRLLNASKELAAILEATPSGAAMVAKDFDASRETAMKPFVGGYQIIHFATHGFFNSEHPELSGIVLAMVKRDGSKVDGFMPLQDIYKLKLSAQLVVLSACETALGKDMKGEGLIGLTRGFMYAGSRSVVTSLWKVDDRATASLMKHFYEAMLRDGMTPAAALRSAKQEIRKNQAWRAPYFWAGFVLQGEYKERIVVGGYSSSRVVLVVSLALLILSSAVILQRRRRARI